MESLLLLIVYKDKGGGQSMKGINGLLGKIIILIACVAVLVAGCTDFGAEIEGFPNNIIKDDTDTIYETVNRPDNHSSGDSETESASRIEVTKTGSELSLETMDGADTFRQKISLNGSKNNAFNLLYIYKNAEGYKAEADDICPVHMYNTYRGGNHGENIAFQIIAPDHLKTEADIGSVWRDSNPSYDHAYVIVRIVDKDTLWLLGEKTNKADTYRFNSDSPVSPLTHVSGGTNTEALAFTEVTKRNQILPGINNISVSVEGDGEPVAEGRSTCDVLVVSEQYDIIDSVKMYDYLAANAGKCTNETYYSDDRDAEMRINNTYRFYPTGLCLVSTTAEALRDNIGKFSYSLTQSNRIHAQTLYLYIPYSIYDSLTVHPDTDIRLDSSMWRDKKFAPYKFYQFNEKGEGFAVGYCIADGQMAPDERKDNLDCEYGAYYSPASTQKMYPTAGFVSLANMGDTISGHAFRTPVKIVDNVCSYYYEVEGKTFVEVEVFEGKEGTIPLPESYNNKQIKIVAKTDSISLSADTVTENGISFTSTGNASMTLCLS